MLIDLPTSEQTLSHGGHSISLYIPGFVEIPAPESVLWEHITHPEMARPVVQ